MTSLTSLLGRRCLPLLAGCLFAVPTTAQCTTLGTTAYWETTWAGCATQSVLTPSGNPVLGTVISLHTDNLPPLALLVGTLILLPPTPLGTPTTNLFSYPLLTGCSNYLPNATDLVITLPVSGATDIALAIPNNLFWLGKVLHCQSAVLTLGFDIEMSNAMCLHLGY
ncbi:MAG: hypothetical protein WAT39_23200 [Planctomycetota bacterium]